MEPNPYESPRVADQQEKHDEPRSVDGRHWLVLWIIWFVGSLIATAISYLVS